MATELDAYMKAHDIKDEELAELVNRDRSHVSKIRRGMLLPTLELAGAIEAATKGAVVMQSWVSTGSHGGADTDASDPPSPGINPAISPCSAPAQAEER